MFSEPKTKNQKGDCLKKKGGETKKRSHWFFLMSLPFIFLNVIGKAAAAIWEMLGVGIIFRHIGWARSMHYQRFELFPC